MIQRRISDSPDPAAPVNRGEPFEHYRQAGTAFFGAFHFGDHVLEKEEASVVDSRYAGTEPSREASGVVFGSDVVGDHLPLHTKRRIR